MAATNHTTNYNLPQYVGTDKPTYLGDWNSTMGAIDTQMKTNADNASGALSAAQTAQTNSNTAITTAQTADGKADTALTNAATAQSTADNASSVASSALSTANSANTKADTALTNAATADGKAVQVAGDLAAFEDKLNLTNFETYDTASKVTVTGGTFSSSNLQVATNSDGSVGKIYGVISMTHASAAHVSCSIQTALRPTSNITISCLGISQHWLNSNPMMGNAVDVTITTTGLVTFICNFDAGTITKYFMFPCLLFMKDFGDTPTPDE